MSDKPHPLKDPHQDLVPTNELQAAQIRDLALNAADSLQQSAVKMQDESAAMARWILASLLAMNIAGAVGTLSSSDSVVGQIGEPLVAFAMGAVFAIGTGLNGLVTGMRMGPRIGNVIEELRMGALESKVYSGTRLKVAAFGPVLRQQLFRSTSLVLGSLFSFGTGILLAVT